jgi:tRNA nucleotidyltransferase/poly(A) polymerase
MLLGRTIHDLDFALAGDAIRSGRRVADALGGAFYPLDTERGTGRVILTQADGARQVLDFARLRGPDLESDLRGRDFTINAIALDLHHPQQLIDPLNGANDLRAQQLRACSLTSLSDDPLRGLRRARRLINLSFPR